MNTPRTDLDCSRQSSLRLQPTSRTISDPREFVDGLAAEALRHRATHHPYLYALATGEVPDLRWALADFGRQYYGYSRHFPRFLLAVISRLELPEQREMLLQNLHEESGNYHDEELEELEAIGVEREWIVGIPHPRLFGRFCAALGVHHDDRRGDADEVVCWREMFLLLLSNGTAAEAVGALGLGTENIVRTIYQPFVEAIARLPELAPRDTVFFPLHTAVDDHHTETLREIAAGLATSETGRRELRGGMLKALSLRCTFWDWLYLRALDPARAETAS